MNWQEIIVLVLSLASPIIAVLMARWTIKSSTEDTAKQIESIKTLSKLQIEASLKQVDLEIEKNLFYAKQAQQEWEGIQKIMSSGLANQIDWRDSMLREFHENKPERDYKLYCQFINDLKGIKQNLLDNMKGLE